MRPDRAGLRTAPVGPIDAGRKTVIDPRPILFVIGILLTTLAAGMVVPALVDLVEDHDDWMVFMTAALTTSFVGISLILTNRLDSFRFTVREAFVLTTASWLVLTAFAALPMVFSSDLQMSYTDAFFEAMSGITTTGSTVMTQLETAPPGILIWRALLQWLGGIGIIVMAIAVMPMLRIGGMQLFRMESSDHSADKAMPRATQLASAIGGIYLLLTAIWSIPFFL